MSSSKSVVVLSGGLSNLDRGHIQSLIDNKSHKARRRRTTARGAWPDGRRRQGSVAGAIIDVLEQARGELSTKAIREQVEQLLGGPVSRHSISDYLLVRSKGPRPLFERTRHAHYRLLR